jgi:amino acid adenylation domain-containing protein
MAIPTSNTLNFAAYSEQNTASAQLLKQVSADDSLLDLFGRAVNQYPARIAVVCGNDTATYSALNEAAVQFASRLLALGVRKGDFVAIYLDRSVSMISAMLGVLKVGAAYLPIDPGYPEARVTQTLEDAKPTAIVTNSSLIGRLSSFELPALLVDATDERTFSEFNDLPSPDADDLAYLMYTSGSTGKPKGVLVTHRNVVRLMTATDAWFNFDENDVWTMFHSFAFDFSVWEIWGPLTTGGRLVIVPFAISRSPEDFYALLSSEQVTVLNQTPSAFSLLCQIEDSGKALPLALRYVIFGGEALQYRSLKTWFNRHGESKPQLVNMYGITETTVHVTYRVVREADTVGDPDSLIGVPIPDLQIHLLDSELKPVAVGEVGEICVGGYGVTCGYLNRPELTAERFVADPLRTDGMKLYRSGDLARRRTDGELVYLGRGDNQVKINGFRIELGEIESALNDYPGIQQACVIAQAAADGRQRLAAYFVTTATAPTAGELSTFLSKRLPPQMMPAFYTHLKSLPLTSNGKVDRVALPKPETGSSLVGATKFKTPMEEKVAAIWRGVLGASTVGADDNFFDIGGTSVLLVSVRSQLQQQLGSSIPVTWMFEFTTVATLAAKLSETGDSQATKPVSSQSSSLTAAQEQARRQREAFAKMKAAKG